LVAFDLGVVFHSLEWFCESKIKMSSEHFEKLKRVEPCESLKAAKEVCLSSFLQNACRPCILAS